jgi:ribosome-associated protein
MSLNPSESYPGSEPVEIMPGLVIPPSELSFRFSRSGGPGGQHVNRSETRVELVFDVAGSPSLSDEQRERLRKRLAGYIDSEGTLHLFSSVTRSQLANRADVVARFHTLLRTALRRRKARIATRPTPGGRERRLSEKRHHSEIKNARRSRDLE